MLVPIRLKHLKAVCIANYFKQNIYRITTLSYLHVHSSESFLMSPFKFVSEGFRPAGMQETILFPNWLLKGRLQVRLQLNLNELLL